MEAIDAAKRAWRTWKPKGTGRTQTFAELADVADELHDDVELRAS